MPHGGLTLARLAPFCAASKKNVLNKVMGSVQQLLTGHAFVGQGFETQIRVIVARRLLLTTGI